ncbi:MAG: hypothetical protein C4560_00935 [Nitrospiraceae bacterium]|nr:MAG: hypothetical protein C4560_00935 [Nitrospiraceae bacterium]
MEEVKCPNLAEWQNWIILLCKKGSRPYVPKMSDLQTYCKTKNFSKCPYSAKVDSKAAFATHYRKGEEGKNDMRV